MGFFGSALSFGARGGEPSTSSLPFQWNQMGTTRGVPSVHVYAKRAGIVDRRSLCAIGSCNSARSPCLDSILSSSREVADQPARRCSARASSDHDFMSIAANIEHDLLRCSSACMRCSWRAGRYTAGTVTVTAISESVRIRSFWKMDRPRAGGVVPVHHRLELDVRDDPLADAGARSRQLDVRV